MKKAYPIILTQNENEKYILVTIPDFSRNTEGVDIADAIEMARDAIGLLGISMEDDGEELPKASHLKDIQVKENEIKTLVDVDFTDYRRKNDLKTVKKNCTLPSWLCYEAEKQGINFSATLQEALKEKVRIK